MSAEQLDEIGRLARELTDPEAAEKMGSLVERLREMLETGNQVLVEMSEHLEKMRAMGAILERVGCVSKERRPCDE